MEDVDDIVREFLVESYENLDQLDRDLVALESAPGERALLGSVFRTIHTIKGTSGFLAFERLERLAHAGENLLAELRDGKREMDGPTTDVLLAVVDRVRELLGAIEATGAEGDVGIDDVVARVEAVLAGEPPASPAPAAVIPNPSRPAEKISRKPPKAERPASEPGLAPEPGPASEPAPGPELEPSSDDSAGRAVAETSIRVDVDLLDALMRQVGELVLARNQIVRLTGTGADELARASQRLDVIATELQEGVMKTRMQPIEHLWSKMPRMVRDLAATCGREVALELSGGDTELDRGLLEAVKDPLTHLVRNAVDHGIEPPDERRAAGKPAKGLLSLRAYHAGGLVTIEVADDGRGIDPEKIAEAAVRKGLRTEAQVATLGPAEVLQLLFLPGFSTAEHVTNVSGRGVGMDVVRTKIEAIGGSVDLESTPGAGTVWRLRIPLTLAIMPALTVACGTEQYAVPQANLLELVALDERNAVEYVHSAPVYRLRGDLLPLVSLSEVLGAGAAPAGVIAVVQSDETRFGLLVDHVLDTEEIVVKALSPRLKSIGVYAGATVLGDGRVALILDVQGLARRALAAAASEGLLQRATTTAAAVADVDQVLVASIGSGRRVAMPLKSVTRLEQIARDAVELVGGREVVQYRGSILPLVRLDRLLGAGWLDADRPLQVIVHKRGARSVGLVVESIVDILDDEVGEHSDVADSGLLGSTVLAEHVTELLDVRAAILAADPDFYSDETHADRRSAELIGAGR
jgi:two-component system chemotaxis sensor kinase CheA